MLTFRLITAIYSRFRRVPRRSRRNVGLGALAVLPLLSGCQMVVSTSGGAGVRIIQASPNAPGIDMYVNSTTLAYNLGFSSVTSYVPINAGTYTINAATAGTTQVLATEKGTLVDGSQYTVLLGSSAADLQELVLKDQSQAAPSGQISLRFIDEASVVGSLDVYLVPAGTKLAAVTPLITNLTFQNTPTYLNVPTGTYTLVLVPTGTVPTSTTVATYTGAQVAYSGGSATTVVLVDQQLVTTPGVQVISATDYTLPTSTS